MYYLLNVFLLILVLIDANATDISAISLYEPISYHRDSSFLQYAASKVGVSTIGQFLNIDEEIKEHIMPFAPKLSKYYPRPNEFSNLINESLIEINKTIVKGKITDDKVTQIYSYVGNNIISKIIDRIMEKEGVLDPKRRQYWRNKIVAPFNSCITTSVNSQFTAKNCMNALSAGLIPNIGIGIVYELSQASLSSALPTNEQTNFNLAQVSIYKDCITNFLPKIEPENVSTCALKAMKDGVVKITEPKLNQTLQNSSSSIDRSNNIKSQVWSPFKTCVQEVGSQSASSRTLANQFNDCVDQLVQSTGVEIVKDKVEKNKSLILTFNKSELKKLSNEKSAQFKKCSDELLAKNIRKNGIIDTSTCENEITNDLIYQSVLKKFNESAFEQVKGTDIDANQLGISGKKILDSCWSQKHGPTQRESCLRKSLVEFSTIIASKRLDFSIPAAVQNKEKIKNDSLVSFKKCLNKNLPLSISDESNLSAKMDPCTSSLLHSATGSVVEESVEAAIKENLKDKKNIDLLSERNRVRKLILDNFHQCMSSQSKGDLTPCTDSATKDATLAIALSAGRVSRTEQLQKSKTPSKEYLAIEEKLKSCTNTDLTGVPLTKHLDDCKKSFVIEVARNLGIEKFENTLKDLLGPKKYEASLPHTKIMLKKYNDCLDNLYADFQDVSICTNQLSRDGELVFKENVNQWMSTEEKDAATLAIKAQFTNFLPCLGGLFSTGGSTPASEVDQNIAPLMEVVSKAIAQYIEYSPENAKQNLDEIINLLAKDLRETSDSSVARKNLVDLLYKNGAFDQFLKSYVKKIVSDSFADIPDSFLPKDLKASLISKENFDAIFNGPEGQKIKESVLRDLINPIIIDGKSGSSPEMVAKVAQVTNQVTQLLVNSPHFGEKIIASQVQGSIDNLNVFKGIFVRVFYGGSNALDWQKVRTTPEGQLAENYIKENIMTPKFKTIKLSEKETKARNDEAERLVSLAVKKYRDPK